MPVAVVVIEAQDSSTGAYGWATGTADGCDDNGVRLAVENGAAAALINAGWTPGNTDQWTLTVLRAQCQANLAADPHIDGLRSFVLRLLKDQYAKMNINGALENDEL
jgi:hypothetical protein